MKIPPKRLTHRQVKQKRRNIELAKLDAAANEMLRNMTDDQKRDFFDKVFSKLER